MNSLAREGAAPEARPLTRLEAVHLVSLIDELGRDEAFATVYGALGDARADAAKHEAQIARQALLKWIDDHTTR